MLKIPFGPKHLQLLKSFAPSLAVYGKSILNLNENLNFQKTLYVIRTLELRTTNYKGYFVCLRFLKIMNICFLFYLPSFYRILSIIKECYMKRC